MAFGRLEPGTVVAQDFIVERLLGEGGMGAVYVVDQPSTGKKRALKIMHREIAANATLQRRFEQEARVGARIESEHVVEVITAGLDRGTGLPYLVMELLEGEDLRRRLERTGPLAQTEALTVLEQLCHALGAAHAAGVVHRDLKPENVFLARSKRATGSPLTVKLLDLGIAKLLAETSTGATKGGVGSPQWMAPEQTAPGPVTAAADVWALGLLAYEVLTGRNFWRASNDSAGTTAQLLREIVLDPIPRASERALEQAVAQKLPVDFDVWFAQCVARDPKARFADAGLAWRSFAKRTGAVSSGGGIASAEAFSDTAVATPPVISKNEALAHGDTMAATPMVRAPVSVPVTVPVTPAGIPPETPIATTKSSPPLTEPTAHKATNRTPLAIGIVIAVVGLVGGYAVSQRKNEPAAMPTANVSAQSPRSGRSADTSTGPEGTLVIATATSTATSTPTSTPTATPTPTLADPSTAKGKTGSASASPSTSTGRHAFGDPADRGAAVQTKVQDTHVRLFTRLVENDSNVADSVLHEGIDHASWEYLRCYSRTYGGAQHLPHAIVTVEYQVLDQLPRFAKLVSSTVPDTEFNECVVGTLVGHTLNAAGSRGAGKAVHAFKFVPME